MAAIWPNHLTPSESALLADSASSVRDTAHVSLTSGNSTVKVCLQMNAIADLSLSVLKHAHALSISELNHLLALCKEHSVPTLEKACSIVEEARQLLSLIL